MIAHPAVLLVVWAGFAFVLQRISLPLVSGAALVCMSLSLVFARQRSLNLIRRSRWLLLSLALLFLFLTPGEYLPGWFGKLGLTHEGLQQAGVQLSRLLALLTSLALLHEHIGTQGLLAGLRWLLGSFRWGEKTVVRLMLVLDYIEQQERTSWRIWLEPQEDRSSDAQIMVLQIPRMRASDIAMLFAVFLAFLAWMVFT